MTPALSVVVPSVRRGSVARTVASVLASARAAGAPVQVIVAWQGAGAAPQLPAGVEVVPVLPAGVSLSRNAGLARAVAELVAFVDDDELVEPGWARAVLQAFADPRVDAAFGQVLPADPHGVPYCELRIDAPRLVRGRRRAPWDTGTGGNMAFRRAALLVLNGFDVRLGAGTPAQSGEDTDIVARLQAAGAVIAQWPDMVVRHPTKSPLEARASRRPYGRGMGVLLRRHGAGTLALNFVSASVWELRRVLEGRDRRRAAELVDTVRGWIGGVLEADEWDAPPGLTTRAPGDVAAALGDRPVRGLPVARRGDLHLVYACGADLILHVRTGDRERLARALAVQRSLAGQPGVPRVRVAADDGAAQWVIEDRLGLHPVPTDPVLWWANAWEWFLALGRLGSGRTRDGSWWARAAEALPRAVPPRWAPLVTRALERVGELPSAPAHGDPRREHLLMAASGEFGAIGWEAAEPDAVAGLDLMALASAGSAPDLDALEAPFGALGVPRPALPALLTIAVAHGTAEERRQAVTLGAPQPNRAPVYGPLLERLGPGLEAAA